MPKTKPKSTLLKGWKHIARFLGQPRPPLNANARRFESRFFVTIWLMKPADFGYFPRLVSLGHAAPYRFILRHCISKYSVFPVFRRE
jgi:hypothetical protein